MLIFSPPFKRLLLVHLVNINSPESLVSRPSKSFTTLQPQLQPRLGSMSTAADRGLAPLLPHCAVIPSSPPANCRGLMNLLNHPAPSLPSGHVFPPKYGPQTGVHRNCRFTDSSVNTSVNSHSRLPLHMLLQTQPSPYSLSLVCLLPFFNRVTNQSSRLLPCLLTNRDGFHTFTRLREDNPLLQTTSLLQSHRGTANCSIRLLTKPQHRRQCSLQSALQVFTY